MSQSQSTVELLARLRTLNVEVSAHEGRLRYNAPAKVLTPQLRAELAERTPEILKILENGSVKSPHPSGRIQRTPRDGKLPLSFAQQRLWFLAQMEGAGKAYHVPLVLRLKGALDHAVLRRALDRVVARHEALRTTFTVQDGEPVQWIRPVEESRILLAEDDLRATEDAAEETDRLIKAEATAPFDLQTGPLVRARLIQLSDDRHLLAIVIHHIASDGWSTPLLIGELSLLYEAFLGGHDDPLPDPEVQYADYAVWQRGWMEGEPQQQQAAYWKTALAGAPGLLEIPADHPRPLRQSYAGAFENLLLDENLTARLKELSRRRQVTLFMTLLTGWAALLSRLSGQTDVLIGMPTANRTRNEIRDLIGFFVNTLVVRFDLSGSPTVIDLLEQARTRSLAAMQNQDVPFERVVELLNPARSLSHSPLFQVMFAWQSNPQEKVNFAGIEAEPYLLPTATAKFDLLLDLKETGNTITGGVEYATSLFEQSTIQRYLESFRTILESMAADETQRVGQLGILPQGERHRLLQEWNQTEAAYPKDDSLAALVEAQVERTPDALAVVDGSEKLTYRALNDLANQLAEELRRHGAGPDEIVALFAGRSVFLVVALLAIIKSGAAYLPLDPLFPARRLAYMLNDCKPKVLITEQALRAALPPFSGTTILLEDPAWRCHGSQNLPAAVTGDNLAYLLYTSGSTGEPKGVAIPRKALANLLWSMRGLLQLSERDRLLAVTTISFDIAGADMWLPLLVGAQTVIATREDASDGGLLAQLIERHKITFLQATPVTWQLLLESGWKGKSDLQAVCTGEAMPPEIATRLGPLVRRLWNLYGPTETTIWSTAFHVPAGPSPILIGRPIANTQIYILDRLLQPVPIGIPGDLYIGGDGLARGYLNRSKLTAERFLPDPFRGAGARIYRTGDLARFRPDGSIECLGRNDHQVKLRGYRIELGEIEETLKTLPGIVQAVAAVRAGSTGDKQLAAYYTTAAGADRQSLSSSEIRTYLSRSLPEYMIPAAFVALESFPLTPNGKLDRNALPAPDRGAASIHNFEPPQGEMETKLAGIWADVLKVDAVGRHDNFFDLGGHSLLAVKLVLRVQEIVPGEALPLRALLEAPTIERLAVWLENHQEDHQPILVPMQPGSPACAPFFCVCAPAGTALGMRPLANDLDKDLPFYSIQNKGLDGSEPCASLKDAARLYVDEMRKVQPNGPYWLGGYCFGALVAFEMACLLEEAGQQVSALFLVDIANPAQLRFQSIRKSVFLFLRHCYRRTIFHVRTIRRMRMARRFSYTWERIKAMYFHGERIVRKGPQKKSLRELPAVLKSIPASAGRSVQIMESMERWGRRVTGQFVPRPFSGNAIVFRSKERFADPYFDQFLGWKPVVRGSIQCVEVEGNHDNITVEPAVSIIAQMINAEVRESSQSKREGSGAALAIH